MDARLGWALIPNVYSQVNRATLFDRSGPVALLRAEMRQPRFFHPNVSLVTRAEVERDLQPAYSFYGARGRIGFPGSPRSWILFEGSYNFEIYRLQEGAAGLQVVGAPPLLFGCRATCALSYLEQAIAFDLRDDRLEPKSGYYLGVAVQGGAAPSAGASTTCASFPRCVGTTRCSPTSA